MKLREAGRDLTHAVQVRENLHGGWRTIAAFDVQVVAEHYAGKCRDAEAAYPTPNVYRVVPITHRDF